MRRSARSPTSPARSRSGGELENGHRKPIEKFLSEPALGDLLGQSAVGRGDDADIHLSRRSSADGDDRSFLQYASSFT